MSSPTQFTGCYQIENSAGTLLRLESDLSSKLQSNDGRGEGRNYCPVIYNLQAELAQHKQTLKPDVILNQR